MVYDKNMTHIAWEQANNDMLFELSLQYANGEGVETDFVLAHTLLNIAASRGCERSIEYRKELAYDMSKEEISKAQKAARELLFGNPPPKAH